MNICVYALAFPRIDTYFWKEHCEDMASEWSLPSSTANPQIQCILRCRTLFRKRVVRSVGSFCGKQPAMQDFKEMYWWWLREKGVGKKETHDEQMCVCLIC